MKFSQRLIRRAIVGGTLITGIGCAHHGDESPFKSVQLDVFERLHQKVRWNRDTQADRSAEVAVKLLLAKPLSADATVQIALLNNRNLQSTFEEAGIAQADLVQAGLLRNPVFNAAFEFADGGGTKLQFSVADDFLQVLQLPLRKRIAQSNLDTVKLKITAAVIELAITARSEFFRNQAAIQLMELRKSVLAATDASYEFARRLHDAGNTPDLELFNEQALHEQAKLDVATAEENALDARERLNVVMGAWGADTNWTVAGRLPDVGEDPATDNLEKRAIEKSLELAVARSNLEATSRAFGIKRDYAIFPQAELGVASEKEADGLWETGPSLSLPIPLFDTGQAAAAGARAQLERSRQNFYAVAVAVRSAARTARNRLISARARSLYLQKTMLPLRRQIVEQTLLQYNAMLVTPFQLLLSKQLQIAAAVQSVEALRDYWLARTQVDALMSGMMTEVSLPIAPSRTVSFERNPAGVSP